MFLLTNNYEKDANNILEAESEKTRSVWRNFSSHVMKHYFFILHT